MLRVKCQPIYKITPNCIKTWTAVSHRTVAWSLQTNQFLAITNTLLPPSLLPLQSSHLCNCPPIKAGIERPRGLRRVLSILHKYNWFILYVKMISQGPVISLLWLHDLKLQMAGSSMCKLLSRDCYTADWAVVLCHTGTPEGGVIIELSSPWLLQFLMSNSTQHSNNRHVLTDKHSTNATKLPAIF